MSLTPSPRVSAFGPNGSGTLFHDRIITEGMPTFGGMLAVLVLLGAVTGWRAAFSCPAARRNRVAAAVPGRPGGVRAGPPGAGGSQARPGRRAAVRRCGAA